MKFKNTQILFVQTVLAGLPLDIQKSSARRRFLRSIKGFGQDMMDEQIEIQNKYAEKDEAGEVKRLANGDVKFIADKKELANKEWKKLIELEVVLKVDESNKKDIKTITAVLEEELKKIDETGKDGYGAAEFEFREELADLIAVLKSK